VGAASRRQPVGQSLQVGRHGAEGPHVLARLPLLVGRQQARDHHPLGHVETTTPLVDDIHRADLLT